MTQSHEFSVSVAARALAASTVAYLEPQSRGLTFSAYNSILNDSLLPPFSGAANSGCTDPWQDDAEDNAAANGNGTQVGGLCQQGEGDDDVMNGSTDVMSQRDYREHGRIDKLTQLI